MGDKKYKDISYIYKELYNIKKIEQTNWLEKEIWNFMFNFESGKGEEFEKKFKAELKELTYPENSTQIERILLFFNVSTIILSNQKNDYAKTDSKIRFAFDIYNREKWSLEHIYPQNDESNEQDVKKYIRDLKILDDNLKEIIEKNEEEFNKNIENKNIFDKFLFKKILKTDANEDWKESEIKDNYRDCLYNLTLLKHSDNSALSNSIFPVKRLEIIRRDKDISFIPICTKNVFLKYYSTTNEKALIWSNSDCEEYFEAIFNTLCKFSEGIINE